MRDLRLYAFMDRFGFLTYRTKILVVAFIGSHVPLIVLALYLALRSAPDWGGFVESVGVTLLATLVGTGITLLILDHLLRPITLTARTLREYRRTRAAPALPTRHTDDVGTLMADTAETLAHLERALDAVEHLDGATGLPNRRRLVLDLGRRMATRGRLAACVIRFSNYNRLVETLDLGAAEAAARAIVERLLAAPGVEGMPYRVGGAEFVFLAGAEDQSAVAVGEWVHRVIAACTDNLTVQSLTITPQLQGAVTVFPDDAETPDELIDHAVAAVALTTDEARIGYHAPAARRAALERMRLEQELRRAISNEEFVLHFQPVVDLSVGRAVGAEALIRWRHPQRGLLPPAGFVDAAEAHGLIDPIGLWVMRKACQQISEWSAAGLGRLRIAVNLSARQFLDPNLIGHVTESLTLAGISPDRLEIELTETAAMADHAHTRAVFTRLRDLGVSIAIDDFGTGYAGMSYLRKLPFDKLKIDREFVAGVHRISDNQAICAALLALGEGLGLRVLAEGVESGEDVRYLRARGCNLYQGYYFSRPLPAAEFRDGLRRMAGPLDAVGVRAPADMVA